ncbi:hypothetical protein [Bradyrhizobium sp. 138]|nr:hypothetical protein [Bradyrhizobium sp. 138]
MNADIVRQRSNEIKDVATEASIVISHRSEIVANGWRLRQKS